MARKTLVIGLGGTGCSVVQQVKNFVGDNTQNIQFVGFDTDSNRAGSYQLDVIRTGRNILAERLMERRPEQNEWFPNNPNLLGRTMQNGAGQVRALSRLAFKDTVKQRGMGKIRRAIETLHTAGENNDTVDFYITIVSSFAGGTGSGMFISLALWLRKYILDTYDTNVIIDGVFALPDVFMDNGNSAVQRESMYANTFAALKELVNVSRVCLSSNPRANEIIMDYRIGSEEIFNSKKDRRDENHLPITKKPFDVMFFFDKVNSHSNVLPGGMDEYIRCMAQCVFMRCFAPVIQDGIRSREDNEIVSQIEKNNENRYGSLGTARLIYPYEDILRYCNLCSAKEAMGRRWNVSEEDYRQHRAAEEELNKLDPSFEMRSRGEIFIDWMNDNIKHSEFAFLQDALVEEARKTVDEPGFGRKNKGTATRLLPRTDVYLKDVVSYITDKAEEYSTLPEKARIRFTQSFSARAVQDIVQDVEERIRVKYKEIKTSFRTKTDYLVNSIVPKDFSKIADSKRGKENIGNLLQKNRKAVHPLATRYLLYMLREQAADKALVVERALKEAEYTVDFYIHKDWIDRTADLDSAMDAIPSAVNVIALKDFVRRYASQSGAAIDALGEYRNNYLLSMVLDGIMSRLDALISQYELLFDMLPEIQKKMDTDIERLENAHRSDSMEQYVCAGAQMKKKIYSSLAKPSDTSRESPMYDSVLENIYNYSSAVIKNRQDVAAGLAEDNAEEDQEARKQGILELFTESILPVYAKELNEKEGNREKLDKNILTALEEEAAEKARKQHKQARIRGEITQGEIDQQRADILRDLANRAAPHLMYSLANIDDATHIQFWGINDLTAKGKNLVTLLNTGSEDTPSVAVDAHYSPYELSVYCSVIGLMISDVRNFIDYGENTGIYYKQYAERLKKIEKGFYRDTGDIKEAENSVTPHADARWHKREFLQPLSEERDMEDCKKAARAMWLGILYGNIDVHRYQRNDIVQYSYTDPMKTGEIMVHELKPLFYKGQPVKNFNQIYELYQAIFTSGMMKEQLLEILEPAYEKDSDSFQAVGASRYNMKGDKANRLLRALTDDEHGDDPQKGKNVLTLLEDVLKQEAYSEPDITMLNAEKVIITAALISIIDGLKMDETRKKTVCAYIAQNSIYRTNLKARNRDAQFLEYFDIQNIPEKSAAAKKTGSKSRTNVDANAEKEAKEVKAETTSRRKKAASSAKKTTVRETTGKAVEAGRKTTMAKAAGSTKTGGGRKKTSATKTRKE